MPINLCATCTCISLYLECSFIYILLLFNLPNYTHLRLSNAWLYQLHVCGPHLSVLDPSYLYFIQPAGCTAKQWADGYMLSEGDLGILSLALTFHPDLCTQPLPRVFTHLPWGLQEPICFLPPPLVLPVWDGGGVVFDEWIPEGVGHKGEWVRRSGPQES